MRKRKIAGIIKYGTRSYTVKPIKLQEGGFVSVSKAYDWRDDPYELMLIRQKAEENNARIKAAGYGRKGKSGSGSGASAKLGDFDPITEGLQVTNTVMNQKFFALRDNYLNTIKSQGENAAEWISSLEGQLAYQNINNERTRLSALAKEEKAEFDKASGALAGPDKEVMALSTTGYMMVREASTGKMAKISVEDYTKGITKYVPQTVSEFMTWKEKEDTALSSGLISEFLVNNAVGDVTMRKNYLDDRTDGVQYKLELGKVVDSATRKTVLDIPNFAKGIKNMMNGQDFISSTVTTTMASSEDDMREAVSTMFIDIMRANGTDADRLDTSLAAEILSSNMHKAKMLALPEANRMNYLTEQKRLLLVSKFVDKSSGSSKSSGASSGSSLGAPDPNMNVGINRSFNMIDGDKIKSYEIGTGQQHSGGVKRVTDISLPMTVGISAEKLKLSFKEKGTADELKNNKLKTNETIDESVDTTKGYMISGHTLADIVGGPGQAANLLSDHAVLTKDEDVITVYLPVDDRGNVMTRELNEMTKFTLKSRQDFIASTKGRKSMGVTTDANALLNGSKNKKVQQDYKEYQLWLTKGMQIEKYTTRLSQAPNDPQAKQDYAEALSAQASIININKKIVDHIGGRPIQIKPFAGISITVGDDKFDMRELVKNKVGTGFGANQIQATNDSENAFYRDTNDIDPTNISWKDRTVKLRVFYPMKDAGTIAGQKGDKVNDALRLREIEDQITRTMNDRSIMSKPAEKRTTYEYLLSS